MNLSARALVGGSSVLVGGFVIGGTTADTVLIRAVGPGLSDAFGLGGTVAQPVLTLFDSAQTTLNSSTGWGGDSTIAAAAATVGAFALNPAHQDSALLATLPPGGYTVQVTGLGGTAGLALLEIYEIP